MGVDGFPSLVNSLNFVDTVYLVNVSPIFLFSLRVCEHKLPLLIFHHQLLNLLLYRSHGTIQSVSFLHHFKQFVLAYGLVPDQGTIDPSYPL